MIDAGKIKLNVGVAISYLNEMPQIWLYEFIRDLGRAPTLEQAEKLKKYQGEHKLTKDVMEVIMTEDTGAGPSISIKTKAIEKYFPQGTSKKDMEDTIMTLLDNWMNRRA
jgi:ParB family chromosome partitioning protein